MQARSGGLRCVTGRSAGTRASRRARGSGAAPPAAGGLDPGPGPEVLAAGGIGVRGMSRPPEALSLAMENFHMAVDSWYGPPNGGMGIIKRWHQLSLRYLLPARRRGRRLVVMLARRG